MHNHPSPAASIAAALAGRAEDVCRRYLPHGRRQGRYWIAGDLDGARGRSLFVRLHGPGTPGKWTDASVGTHGDLLDLIRHRTGAPTLRAALDHARAFLALPASPLVHGGGPGVERIAASWAEKRGVHQIVCKPDWDRHGRAAPFRRNDDLLNLLPKGVIAFPGSGITDNLVDKARQLGIPVHKIEKIAA